MEIINVKGKKTKNIILYALSTCVWCKKTKALLDEMKIEYNYIYVDKLSGKEKENTENEIKKWNPRISFPTIIIDNKDCITGYEPDQIKKAIIT